MSKEMPESKWLKDLLAERDSFQKRVMELENVTRRQTEAIQSYLVAVQNRTVSGKEAVEMYLANHEACKALGIPIKTAVKQ